MLPVLVGQLRQALPRALAQGLLAPVESPSDLLERFNLFLRRLPSKKIKVQKSAQVVTALPDPLRSLVVVAAL